MTDREAMQQALWALEGWANQGEWVWPESALEQAKRNTTESIAALRERLAQPEQWQGLTDEEQQAAYDAWQQEGDGWGTFYALIEAKLKEKNHG